MNEPQPITRHYILDALHEKGVSIRRLSDYLEINRAHLQRVLRGERPASQALMRAAAEYLDSITLPRTYREINGPLLDAAVHIFFLRRGYFQSPLSTGLGKRKPRRSPYLQA